MSPRDSELSTPATTVAINLRLLQLTKLDPKSDEFTASLRETLYSEDYPKLIESLKDDETQEFVEFLDKSLDTIPEETDFFHKCLRALRKLCGLTRQLPSSFKIPEDKLVREGEHPVASGGFSDVWIGILGQRKVALKCLKMFRTNELKVLKSFCKEVVVLRRLSHPNILPLLGVSTMGGIPCMVSEWMEHGTINDYVRAHPNENRLRLLSEVAEGLGYLHSRRVVHGNLKGFNILIDNSGRVRLAGFGLNSITTDDNSFNASTVNSQFGITRWMAPEILSVDDGDNVRPTQESDIYAFAMVVIEVFTGLVPFRNLSNLAAVIRSLRGERPPRPEEAWYLGLSDRVWGMVERCWEQDPAQRPRIFEVLRFFKNPDLLFASRISYLANLDPNDNGFTKILRNTLYSDDYLMFITSLQEDEAKTFINFLDQALDCINGDPELLRKCLRALRKICGLRLQLPSSYDIPKMQLIRKGKDPFAIGGCSDVWAGTFGRRKVAIKCLRIIGKTDSAKIMKALCKEVIVWKRLSHPNILPLLGVSTMESRLCIVSEQMMNGTIMDYLESHPKENRLALLSDIAAGLEYMHSFRIVHADLKGANILIDNLGHALLADFGLTFIAIDSYSVNASLDNHDGGTWRWMDPNLLNLDEQQAAPPKLQRDIYSFAMVAIEVFTGRVPFPDVKNGLAIVLSVATQGRRPDRPKDAQDLGLSDSVWEMVQKCWKQDPSQRPEISEVLDFFKEAAAAHALVLAPP